MEKGSLHSKVGDPDCQQTTCLLTLNTLLLNAFG